MRAILNLLFCALTVLLFAHPLAAEIYKTVDKQGRIVYTDQPPANTQAKIVELPSINSLPPTQVTPAYNTAPNAGALELHYQVNISSPVSGVTLQADERNLAVAVGLDQALQTGDMLAYFLDGVLLEKTTNLTITLVEPPRGEHKLHVEVMSKYGKSLGQSAPVTIVVMRPIAKPKPIPKPIKVPRKH
jgi:hypothetical protein